MKNNFFDITILTIIIALFVVLILSNFYLSKNVIYLKNELSKSKNEINGIHAGFENIHNEIINIKKNNTTDDGDLNFNKLKSVLNNNIFNNMDILNELSDDESDQKNVNNDENEFDELSDDESDDE